MKSKKANKLNFTLGQPRLLVGIVVVICIGLAIAVYAMESIFGQRLQSSDVPTTQTVDATPYPDLFPTASPMPEMVVEVKDGVYTNYTYGFSFEYDTTLFPQVNHDRNGYQSIFLSNKGEHLLPTLEVRFLSSATASEHWMKLFFECKNVAYEDGFDSDGVKKYDTDQLCGGTFSNIDNHPSEFEGELVHGYRVFFHNKSQTGLIIMWVPTEQDLKDYLHIIDQIVYSLRSL